MPVTKRRAAYLGTFDPLTLGHCDIIARASKLFDELVIGIGNNPAKASCFSPGERLAMAEEICQKWPNVRVQTFQGLAVHFALAQQASVLIRGLRTEADYVYEMQMAMMNRVLALEIETLFIPTRQDLSHVSSSLVKEVASFGGDVSSLVPKLVSVKLQEKFVHA